jgi:hypothetical protein
VGRRSDREGELLEDKPLAEELARPEVQGASCAQQFAHLEGHVSE